MVLDPDQGDASLIRDLLRHHRGVVFGMEVADDRPGRHLQQLFHPAGRLPEGRHRAQVLQVPHIGGQVEEIARGDAEGVFELPAYGQDAALELCLPAAPSARIQNGKGGVAPGSADHIGMAPVEVHDRIVRADPDQAVVAEDAVAEAGQLFERVRIIPADRRPRYVSAGHDQAVRHLQPVVVVKEQKLQGRVGEHDPDLGVSRRDRRSQKGAGTVVSAVQQEDGLLVAGQDLLLLFIEEAFPADCLHIPHHDREGLGRPVLAGPEPFHRRLIGGVAAQVEAADPLDRDDPALQDGPPGGRDGIPPPGQVQGDPVPVHGKGLVLEMDPHSLRIRSIQEIDLRAAVIAADRLGVVAPGQGTVILLGTGPAHGKHLHAGPLPVVGQGVQDGQPRAAAGAVDKRMEVSFVRRVVHLPDAVLADRNVRRDEDLPPGLFALYDGKSVIGRGFFQFLFVDPEDGGPARGLVPEQALKGFDLPLLPLRHDLDIGPLVADAAPDPGCRGMPVDGGPESDPLDDPVYTKTHGCECIHIRKNLSLLRRLTKNAESADPGFLMPAGPPRPRSGAGGSA